MSEKLIWLPAYQVGEPEIDLQHKKLFKMINALQSEYESGNNKTNIQNILEEMGNYLNTHFSCEEGYLKNHPNLAKHRKEHWMFVEKTMKYTRDFDANDAIFEYDILDFLKRWLVNHVLNTDIVFFRELKKQSAVKPDCKCSNQS
ncbi:Hemerythrin-like metal-binding protein [Candidatus Magnetomorum sp. HK-1]|nr:Hemerythrin-like metal-binding protein [Candidatus Magnetomorum sp. HK-1]